MTWVSDQGWFPYSISGNRANNLNMPDEVGIDEGGDGAVENFYSVYTKFVGPGTLVLNQADNGGRNVYGVVISAIPEPGIASLRPARRRPPLRATPEPLLIRDRRSLRFLPKSRPPKACSLAWE